MRSTSSATQIVIWQEFADGGRWIATFAGCSTEMVGERSRFSRWLFHYETEN